MYNSFQRKLNAIGDIIDEMAHQLFLDGEFKEEIKTDILEGGYDTTILEYLDDILPAKLVDKVKEYLKG